jgi:hypothetical protein
VHLYADGGIVLGIEISDPVPAMTCVMYEITKNRLKLELIGRKEQERKGGGGREGVWVKWTARAQETYRRHA